MTMDSRVVVAPDQFATDMAGEMVVLNTRSGSYYSLHGIGSTLWGLVQQPKTLREVHAAVLAEYAVSSDRCERDLVRVFGEMEAEGIIEVVHDASG